MALINPPATMSKGKNFATGFKGKMLENVYFMSLLNQCVQWDAK